MQVDVLLLLLLHSFVDFLIPPGEVGERRLKPLNCLHDVVGADALPAGRAVQVVLRLLDLPPVEQHLSLEVGQQPSKVLEGGHVLVLHRRRRVPRALRHLHVQQLLRRGHLKQRD